MPPSGNRTGVPLSPSESLHCALCKMSNMRQISCLSPLSARPPYSPVVNHLRTSRTHMLSARRAPPTAAVCLGRLGYRSTTHSRSASFLLAARIHISAASQPHPSRPVPCTRLRQPPPARPPVGPSDVLPHPLATAQCPVQPTVSADDPASCAIHRTMATHPCNASRLAVHMHAAPTILILQLVSYTGSYSY